MDSPVSHAVGDDDVEDDNDSCDACSDAEYDSSGGEDELVCHSPTDLM